MALDAVSPKITRHTSGTGHQMTFPSPAGNKYTSGVSTLFDSRVLKEVNDFVALWLPSFAGNEDVETLLKHMRIARLVSTYKSLYDKVQDLRSSGVALKADKAYKQFAKSFTELGKAVTTTVKYLDESLSSVNLPECAKKVIGHLDTTFSVVTHSTMLHKMYDKFDKDDFKDSHWMNKAQFVAMAVGGFFAAVKVATTVVENFGFNVKTQPVVAKALEIAGIFTLLGVLIQTYKKHEEERETKLKLASQTWHSDAAYNAKAPAEEDGGNAAETSNQGVQDQEGGEA